MSASPSTATEPWYLYLIECAGGRYYAGISNDVHRRYEAHLAGKGARFTRAFPPVRLLGFRKLASKSLALKAEHAIRKLPRPQKLAFVQVADPIGTPKNHGDTGPVP